MVYKRCQTPSGPYLSMMSGGGRTGPRRSGSNNRPVCRNTEPLHPPVHMKRIKKQAKNLVMQRHYSNLAVNLTC